MGAISKRLINNHYNFKIENYIIYIKIKESQRIRFVKIFERRTNYESC